MSLPTSRDITIANGDPIPSALLNKLQDCAIGNKKPSLTRTLSSLSFPWIGSWATPGAGYVLSNAGGIPGVVPLYMETGDRITEVTISSYGTGALTVNHELVVVPANMVPNTLVNVNDVNRAAAWGDFVYGVGAAAYVMNAGDCLYLVITAGSANARLGNIRWNYDRL